MKKIFRKNFCPVNLHPIHHTSDFTYQLIKKILQFQFPISNRLLHVIRWSKIEESKNLSHMDMEITGGGPFSMQISVNTWAWEVDIALPGRKDT